jgi:hypothetical protein
LFFFCFAACWAQAALRCSVRSPVQRKKEKKKKRKKKLFFFLFLFCRLLGAGGPAALCAVACEEKEYFYFYFYFILFAGDLVERRGAASAQQGKGKTKNKLLLLFFSRPSGSTPRTSAGLSHGSPPTSYLLTPTYLYYYIRLLMSLISLFFFALTFGKPLNYFTCEKEDF